MARVGLGVWLSDGLSGKLSFVVIKVWVRLQSLLTEYSVCYILCRGCLPRTICRALFLESWTTYLSTSTAWTLH